MNMHVLPLMTAVLMGLAIASPAISFATVSIIRSHRGVLYCYPAGVNRAEIDGRAVLPDSKGCIRVHGGERLDVWVSP